MDTTRLHKKLIAAARNNPPSEMVPYAFEKRIMARLVAQPVPDAWLAWGAALWRAAAACVAISVLAALLSQVSISEKTGESSDLETAMAAAAQDLGNTW
jgi:hypothetical protein